MTVSYPDGPSPLTRRPKRLHAAVAVAGLLMFAGGGVGVGTGLPADQSGGPFLIDTAKIQNGHVPRTREQSAAA